MKKESAVYSCVFIFSTVTTGILLCIMLFQMFFSVDQTNEKVMYKSAAQNTEVIRQTTSAMPTRYYEIKESDLKESLNKFLNDSLGIELETLLITNDTVSIMANIAKSNIVSHIEKSGIEINRAADVALKIAPEIIDIGVDFKIKINSESKTPDIEVVKMSVLGFNVPASVLPESLFENIDRYFNGKLAELSFIDFDISLKNGKIILFGK